MGGLHLIFCVFENTNSSGHHWTTLWSNLPKCPKTVCPIGVVLVSVFKKIQKQFHWFFTEINSFEFWSLYNFRKYVFRRFCIEFSIDNPAKSALRKAKKMSWLFINFQWKILYKIREKLVPTFRENRVNFKIKFRKNYQSDLARISFIRSVHVSSLWENYCYDLIMISLSVIKKVSQNVTESPVPPVSTYLGGERCLQRSCYYTVLQSFCYLRRHLCIDNNIESCVRLIDSPNKNETTSYLLHTGLFLMLLGC